MSLIHDDNHHVAVLLATPVVLVNLFLLLGDRKINVGFYTQLDTTYAGHPRFHRLGFGLPTIFL